MIKSILVNSSSMPEPLEIDLANPYKTGLAISSISGIDPGSANINLNEVATSDGSYYASARKASRNIVLGLVVLDEWPTDVEKTNNYETAIEFNRHRLYSYFPIKKLITFRVISDSRELEISGYVESISVGVFSSMQAAQVSILCPFPYFKDVSNRIDPDIPFGTVERVFEFPEPDGWSNEIGDEVANTIISTYSISPSKTFEYAGDIDTGYVITLHFLGRCGDIYISDTVNNTEFKIKASSIESIIGSNISASNELVISSIVGEKKLTYYKGVTKYNVLNSLMSGSVWPKLSPGSNTIAVYSASGLDNIEVKITADIYYAGI